MGTSLAEPFMYEARWSPETKTRTGCVGIKCRRCSRADWHAAPSPGWGRRIYKHRGWIVGNRPNDHLCPDCVAAPVRSHAQRRDDREDKVIVAMVGPQEKLPERLPTPEELRKGIVRAEPLNTAMSAALAPLRASMEATEVPVKKSNNRAGSKNTKTYGATDGYVSPIRTRRAAKNALAKLGVTGATEGVHYKIEKSRNGTFGYILLNAGTSVPTARPSTHGADRMLAIRASRPPSSGRGVSRISTVPPNTREMADMFMAKVDKRMLRPGVTGSNKTNVRLAATRMLYAIGVDYPVDGVHYAMVRTATGRWTYQLLFDPPVPPNVIVRTPPEDVQTIVTETPKETPTVTDASSQAVRDAEEATPAASGSKVADIIRENAEAARKASPAENKRIRQQLDDIYDEDGEMYRGDWTDKKVGEALDLPRIFIERVRELYGPDRNNEAEIKAQAVKLRAQQTVSEATKVAAAAIEVAKQIIELGGTLETMMGLLEAKKRELGL